MNIADRLHGFRSSPSQLQSVIIDTLIHLVLNQEILMTILDDIKAKQAQALTELQSDDNLISSLTTALQTKDAAIADLNTKLQAALANNDTAALQEVSDAMDGLVSEADSQNSALVAAVQANTTPPTNSNGDAPQHTGSATAANASPVITSITPDNGAPGDTVTINGQNFVASESVTFGGVAIAATDMDISADGTSITAKVPAGTGQAQVLVGNGVGTSNSVPFSFGASNANPNAAPATSGNPNLSPAAQASAPTSTPASTPQQSQQQDALSNTSPVGIGGETEVTKKDDGTEVQGTPA